MANAPARKRPVKAVPAVVTVDDGTEDDLSEPVEHTVTFLRDGEDEPHTFLARPEFDYKIMYQAVTAGSKNGPMAIKRFENMIRPSLLDDDGVPSKWQPERTDDGNHFTDPDGNQRPIDDLPSLLAPDAGSSRRRWRHLMDEDDELRIRTEEVVRFYEVLIEAATGRPTQRSRS